MNGEQLNLFLIETNLTNIQKNTGNKKRRQVQTFGARKVGIKVEVKVPAANPKIVLVFGKISSFTNDTFSGQHRFFTDKRSITN